MLRHNPVMAARYQAMTAGTAAPAAGSRQPAGTTAAARARRARARVACAAALLRWIYSLVVHGTSWDPAVASGTTSQNASRCPAQAA